LGLNLSALEGAERVAVVGVGSDLRGDDAAGVEVVRRLEGQIDSPRVLLVDAGAAPENFTSKIRKFEPSHVVIVDATDLGLEPGAVGMVDSSTIVGRTTSTHRLPLSMFIDYLREQTSAEVLMIGIQPVSAEMGASVSREVEEAIDNLAEVLLQKLSSL
jgi:hydrogenase 3 maturation protease